MEAAKIFSYLTNFVIPAQAGIQASWHSRMLINLKSASMQATWIPAYAPQGHSDLLSAKALAKSYAGMTGVLNG